MKNKMHLYRFLLLLAFLSITIYSEVYRFNNDTEIKIGRYQCKAIIHYDLYVSSAQQYTIETKNLTDFSDTYMYLWSDTEHRQIAKDDDGGIGYASKIIAYLNPGHYKVFVRSYSGEYNEGWCDLVINGYVMMNSKFSGTPISLWSYGFQAETRLRTKNVLTGVDPYCIVTNSSGNIIAYNDDIGLGQYGSCLNSAEEPKDIYLGAFGYWSEGVCEVWVTEDKKLEFLSLYGSESRHSESSCDFTNNLSGSYTNIIEPWDAMGLQTGHIRHSGSESTMNGGVDDVDFIWIHSHGGIGTISTYNNQGVDITSSDCAAGGNHRLNDNYGDLEYIAFLACKTVRIEHTQSFGWLRTRGWKTYNNNGTIQKGFFDGVHIVVGYHSNHHNYDHSIYGKSWRYEGKTFAKKLKSGNTVWNAWWKTNEDTYQEFSNWFKKRSPGMASSISIVAQKDEKLSDFRSEDIVYGNSQYLMNIRWYGRDSDTPQP